MIVGLIPSSESDESGESTSMAKIYGIALPIAYFFGIFFCRTFMV